MLPAASGPVRVLPTPERVEEELVRLARASGGAALGLGFFTTGKLWRTLLAAAELAPVPAAAAELVAARVAPEAAIGTALEGVAAEPGFAPSFLEVYDSFREGGCGAGELAHVARRLDGLLGERLRGLSRIAGAYEETLAALGACDEAGARLLLPGRLASCALPEELERAPELHVEDLTDVSVALARVLQALAARGKRVVVLVPDLPGRVELAPALEALERTLEAVAPGVTVGRKAYGGGPLAPFHRRLFDATGWPFEDGLVELVEGDDPEAELRAVVATVRARLAAGAAPDDVCVAVRGLARHRDRLASALGAAGIPTRDRLGEAALAAPPCALALQVVELSERGFPREELAALIASRYVVGGVPASADGPEVPARRIAELLREAGSRDDAGEGHAGRLLAHARRLATRAAAETRPRARADLAAEASSAERAAGRLRSLLPALQLPRVATVGAHVQRLGSALQALGLPDRTRASAPDDDRFPAVDAAAARALARDEASLRALATAGAALADAARRVKLLDEPVPLPRVRELLAAALEAQALRTRGARGGAVVLADARELPGRELLHLVVADLVDGSFPSRRGAEPLLDDEDRDAVNAAAGRRVLRSRAAEEPLLFALACLAARETLVLTRALADADGRETIPSPFLLAAVAALGGREPRREPSAVVSPARACTSVPQLLARAALLASGAAPAAGDPPAGDVLRAVRSDPGLAARLARALARAAAEADRGGRLATPEARGVVAARLAKAAQPFGPGVAWATSVSALEEYAGCPFRFFARRVLDLPELAGKDDDLDAREGGTLLHEVVAGVFAALREEELLPLAGGERSRREAEVAGAACERALDRWQDRERTGPRSLWELRREQARAAVSRLLEAEARRPSDLVPAEFEVPFGDEGSPPLLLPSPDGPGDIVVRGRVDRVDRSPRAGPAGAAVEVLDYKSGRVEGRVRADELGRSSFQLAIYAAWARQRYGATQVDAALRSLKDGARSRTLTEACDAGHVPLGELLDLDPGRRADARAGVPVAAAAGAADLPPGAPVNVADTAWRFLRAIRDGRFDVHPFDPHKACEHCDLATVCRVDRGASTEEAP